MRLLQLIELLDHSNEERKGYMYETLTLFFIIGRPGIDVFSHKVEFKHYNIAKT